MRTLISTLKIGLVSLLVFLAGASIVSAKQRVQQFVFPNIKDSFCGSIINYQYCKCAFHNKYCKNIGQTKSSASYYVWNEYREWVRKSINIMGEECVEKNGIWSISERSCTICFGDEVSNGSKCVDAEVSDNREEDEAEENNKNDCIVDKDFDKNWQKYSDIDERLGVGERSYEAEQYISTMEYIVQMKGWIYELKALMEVDRIKRLELRNMRDALVHNQKVNLLKAFWRLSYITYSTIDSSKGGGETFVEFLNPASVVGGIAKGTKLLQANMPKDATLSIDTSDIKGKVRSVGANAALEIVDTLGDPTKVITKVFGDSIKSTFPSADISPEEIQILRDQYLKNHSLDVQIQDSYRVNGDRLKTILQLKKEVAEYEAKATKWLLEEKGRVKNVLEKDCKNDKK